MKYGVCYATRHMRTVQMIWDVALVYATSEAEATAKVLADVQDGVIYCIANVMPYFDGTPLQPAQASTVGTHQRLDSDGWVWIPEWEVWIAAPRVVAA